MRRLTWVSITLLAVMAGPVHAQEVDPATEPLAYVPKDTMFIMTAKPSELLRHKAVSPMAEEANQWASAFGFDLSKISKWSFVARAGATGNLVILVAHEPHDFETLIAEDIGSHETRLYQNVAYGAGRSCFLKPAPNMLVLGSEEAIRLAIETGPTGGVSDEFRARALAVRKDPFASVIDMQQVHDLLRSFGENTIRALGPIGPLVAETKFATVRLSTDDGIRLTAALEPKSEDAIARLKPAAEAGLTLLRAQFEMLLAQMDANLEELTARSNPPESYVRELQLVNTTLRLAVQSLKDLPVVAQGNRVEATTSVSTVLLGRTSGKLAPILRKERKSIVRARRVRNLKQIGVALHNYHDVFGSLPPSAQLGRDGKGQHPVSWRVLLLPFVDENEMFEQYRFDEPWDSPHNAKVTTRIPKVYRAFGSTHPTHTSYFGLVGTEDVRTCFHPIRGVRIADIIDGTSNTLMVVETKLPVHWAKPQDIVYDPAQPLPPFGGVAPGGFRFIRADGSVGFIATGAPEQSVRNFITRNDLQIIDSSLFSEEPSSEGDQNP